MNVRNLCKLIVAKGFKNLPKVQQIARSGHTEPIPKIVSYIRGCKTTFGLSNSWRPTEAAVWPDLAKFRHFGTIMKELGNFLRVFLVFGKMLSLLWQKCFAICQVFIVVNSHILWNDLAIWSHWTATAFCVTFVESSSFENTFFSQTFPPQPLKNFCLQGNLFFYPRGKTSLFLHFFHFTNDTQVWETTKTKPHFPGLFFNFLFPLRRRSVTRFCEISPFWPNLQSLGQFFRIYLLLGKILDRFRQMLNALGQVFIDVNGQILKNNLAIWSHCCGAVPWYAPRVKG